MNKIKIDSTSVASAYKQFNVSSGELAVTDPCYSIPGGCVGKLENVRNGLWYARAGYYKDPHDMKEIEKYLNNLNEENKAFSARLDKIIEEEKMEDYEKWDLHSQEFINGEIEKYKNYKGRVCYLRIHHAPIGINFFDINNYSLEDMDIGVDSGQAGFFDYEEYRKAHEDDDQHERKYKSYKGFYKEVSDLTLSRDSFGAIDFGAVASSGYGDGCYPCLTKRDEEGKLIAACILFIYDDEEEDDEG